MNRTLNFISFQSFRSVLPMNIQDWFPLGMTALISLQAKGLSRVFSNTTDQKHHFCGTQLSVVQLSHPYINSVQFSCSVMSNSLRPHGLQHTRPPCPSPTPRVYSNTCQLSQWCHPTSLSSVIPFSPCLQSFPSSGSFQLSQLFASGGQGIGVLASTSDLPMNIQDWFPLGWTGRITLKS